MGTCYGEFRIKENSLSPYAETGCKSTDETAKSRAVPEISTGRSVRRAPVRYFNRSPRNIPSVAIEPVEIEAPPSPRMAKERPVFLTIGPAFTMAVPMLLGCSMAILSSRIGGRSSGVYMFTGLITAVSSALLGILGLMNLKYSRENCRRKRNSSLMPMELSD